MGEAKRRGTQAERVRLAVAAAEQQAAEQRARKMAEADELRAIEREVAGRRVAVLEDEPRRMILGSAEAARRKARATLLVASVAGLLGGGLLK